MGYQLIRTHIARNTGHTHSEQLACLQQETPCPIFVLRRWLFVQLFLVRTVDDLIRSFKLKDAYHTIKIIESWRSMNELEGFKVQA